MSGNESHDSFVERLDRHRGILYKIAAAYCREPASREDLRQEIVMQLWRSYGRFDERVKFSTWMYRIALNVAISFARRWRRKEARMDVVEPAIIEALPSRNAQPRDERIERVLDFIHRLDELHRALMLLYLDDYPYAEIAAILGITQTNVATKIARVKERLARDVAARPTS